MRFLIDVHLPISLSKFLSRQTDCQSIHINQILDRWHTSDKHICQYADENDFVVITKDSDFKNTHFINKTPKKVIRVLLGNISNNEVLLLFERYMEFIAPLNERNYFYIEISREQIIVID